jgi:hypothetical protein
MRATECAPRSSLNDLSDTPAEGLLETHRSALDLDWLSLPPAQGFAALSSLPFEVKQRLFAWCIAACLKPQLAIEDRADPVTECAGRRLAIPSPIAGVRPRPIIGPREEGARPGDRQGPARRALGARSRRREKGHARGGARNRVRSFDPAQGTACIGLDQAVRGSAAVWMPPGMAYSGDATDDAAAEPGSTMLLPAMSAATRSTMPTSRQPTCPPSSPKTSPQPQRSTAPQSPDAHFRNGDRAPAAARPPLIRSTANHPQSKEQGDSYDRND